MYYTKYFSGISLSTLKTTVNNLSSKIDTLKTKNEEVYSTVTASNWECDAKNHFSEGFDANASIIETIKDQVTHFISAIEYAEKIVEKQEYMNTEGLDYSTLTTNASDIDTDLTSFKNEITSMDVGLNYITSSLSDSPLSVFVANLYSISKVKEEYTSLSSDLVSAYDLFNSIESMVSGDSYLKYGWSIIAKNFDTLIEKRDNMYDWIYEYVDNLTTIENNLPDVVKGITTLSGTIYCKSRNYESEPSFDDYKSSAQGEEIKEPVQETTTDSGGSSYYGGGNSSTTTSKSNYSYEDFENECSTIHNDYKNGKITDTEYEREIYVLYSKYYGVDEAEKLMRKDLKTMNIHGSDKTGAIQAWNQIHYNKTERAAKLFKTTATDTHGDKGYNQYLKNRYGKK